MEKNKVRFSKLGFILAASGSAVGLGNIWKFPYITGENGGGVFVLVYLLTVVLIGMSIFLAEVLMGRNTHADAVSSFEILAQKGKKLWKFAGFSLFIGLLILSFYSVVIGWIFHYIVVSLTSLPSSVAQAETLFMNMLQVDYVTQLFYFTIAMVIIVYTITKGVKQGIEKFNKVLMPTLVSILLFMLFYSMTLDGFTKALEFLFYPNVEKFHTSSIIVAVGHAFFTLSIGMAVILTYASSVGREVNIVKSSVIIVIMDTLIALVAGIIIFSILFTSGAEPGKGPGLVFITLPAIFYQMGTIGNVLAILFFVSLAFAGLTSAISILEPMVMYLEKRWNVKRKKGAIATSIVLYIMGIFALLSNTKEFSQALTIGSKNIFDWFDFLSASILMPLGGIAVAIFVGYFMDKELIRKELHHLMGDFFFKIWLFSLRYVVPVAITFVILNETGIFKL